MICTYIYMIYIYICKRTKKPETSWSNKTPTGDHMVVFFSNWLDLAIQGGTRVALAERKQFIWTQHFSDMGKPRNFKHGITKKFQSWDNQEINTAPWHVWFGGTRKSAKFRALSTSGTSKLRSSTGCIFCLISLRSIIVCYEISHASPISFSTSGSRVWIQIIIRMHLQVKFCLKVYA